MTNLHIMLVDNEKDLIDVSALLLKRYSYRVSQLYNAPSALAAIEELAPDAILLDISMPPIDGYEVCRRIRAESWRPIMSVIALTGFDRTLDVVQSFEAGFNAHVIKPASMEELHEVVTRCITSRRNK